MADLLEGQRAEAVIADKADDSNVLCEKIAAMKAEVVIRCKRNRKNFIPHDVDFYEHKNRIERYFNRLKHFRRFATPLRPTNYPLGGLRPSGCIYDLVTPNVDPP